MKKTRRWIAPIAALVVTAVAIAAASAATSSTHARSAPAKKFRIALANSFIGNTWRVEMANLFKGGCQMPPYSKQVTCSVYNSGNDVSKQTQQISNLISQHVDAIVINAASPTGLNGIIKQACDRGIVVVSFDNVVTAPCAQTVNTNQLKFGTQMAQYLVDQLKGKGNVIMVTGVAGTFADAERNKGAEAVFKANPGIKVVAKYSGNWASADAQRATAAQLPSLPHSRRRLGAGRHRWSTEGVRRRWQAAPDHRRRGRERLPPVPAAAGLQGPPRPGHVARPAAVPLAGRSRTGSCDSGQDNTRSRTSRSRSPSSPTRPSSRV